MKLKLACADFSFPLLPHDHVLDLIATLGIQGVDIGLFEGRTHLWPSKVLRDICKASSDLAHRLRDRGLKPADISVHPVSDFHSLAPNHPDPKKRRVARELCLRTLEFTSRCGGRHVTMLPGVHYKTESYSESLKRCSEELAWRCEKAQEHGITFSVEAHIGSIVPTPAAAAKLVRMTPGLTLTVDYTHFVRAGIPESQIEPLVQFASHFHARAGCKGRLQASFKHNTIDYARILRAMKSAGYNGYVALEYVWIEWERCNEVDNLSETILLRDFLKSVKL